MTRKRVRSGELRTGERVVAVETLGKLPVGSRGTVKAVAGLTWIRYWVAWDAGEWMSSLDEGQIVREQDYEGFMQARAEAAARSESPALSAGTPATAEAAPTAPAGATATSRIPAHLLERSAAARAHKAAPTG